jgi:hypothetical protein
MQSAIFAIRYQLSRCLGFLNVDPQMDVTVNLLLYDNIAELLNVMGFALKQRQVRNIVKRYGNIIGKDVQAL